MFKKILLVSLLLCSFSLFVKAQSDETRNKLEMSINFNGKTIVSELLSVSPSISRYSDDYYAPAKDSAGKHNPLAEKRNSFYLSMVVQKMKPELLSVFAKKANRFAGTITVTDTYGKNPPTVIRFTDAALETYSDQFSRNSYADSYSGVSLSITCKTINISGVEIEP